jgi:Pyruvate/2-oxoacid:ferredoxin oxidoreductase delta subunit
MCEFCIQHGDGKKWYLEARNYSEDLLSDLRRRKFIEEFFTETGKIKKFNDRLALVDRMPGLLKWFVRWRVDRFLRKNHHGQVVPIEDIERIFSMTTSVMRTSCLCRHVTTGEEKRYCYGVSMGPDGGRIREILQGIDTSFSGGPDLKGAEALTRDQAISLLREHERDGLCHTIWTFVTPFIAGICNCDRPDCLAMKSTITHGLPMLYRAEYVAIADPLQCSGCRRCMRVCQFGAISYSAGTARAVIDLRKCYGCGICRSVCEKNAITLRDRAAVPAVANFYSDY